MYFAYKLFRLLTYKQNTHYSSPP